MKLSDILLKKHKLHLSCLFCCNHTCYCVNMVSMTSASHYITSASCYHPRYQSRSQMYICGMIPRNWPGQFQLTCNRYQNLMITGLIFLQISMNVQKGAPHVHQVRIVSIPLEALNVSVYVLKALIWTMENVQVSLILFILENFACMFFTSADLF